MTIPKVIITSTPIGDKHFYDKYGHNQCKCGHNYFSGGYGHCKWCLDEDIEEICNNLNAISFIKGWSTHNLFFIKEYDDNLMETVFNPKHRFITIDASKCKKIIDLDQVQCINIEKIIFYMLEVILNKYSNYYNLIIAFKYNSIFYFRTLSHVDGVPILENKNWGYHK